jgi:hypothetical protein
MKKRIPYIIVLMLVSALTVLLIAQNTPSGPSRIPDDPVNQFLGMNCKEPRKMDSLIASLRENSAQSQAAFQKIIEQGPDERLVEMERAEAKGQFARNRDFRSSHKVVHEGFEGAQPPRDEASYVAGRIESLKRRLSIRSLEGIDLLGTPESKAYLAAKARDAKFPFQAEAAELLRQ